MHSVHLYSVLLVSWCARFIHCSNILMVTLAGTKSHKIPFNALGKGLAERRHNVTFVNAFPTDNSNSLISEIYPTNLVMYVQNFTNWDLLGPRLRGQMPVPIVDVFKFAYQACEAFLSDHETKMLMRQNAYDLVILDGAYPECAVGLAHHFRAPFIYINTVGFYTGSLSQAGNPAPYSVTPFFGLAYSDSMNVLQRLVNSVYHTSVSLMHAIIMRYFLHPILRTHISSGIPNPYEMSKNVSLIFQNGHFSLTYPRPFLPSVVEVACLHCHSPKPLPAELESFVNGGSGKGFVYVSMGSSVKASNMPEELRVLFLSVFRSLPYQILWKWESSGMAQILDLPENVLLGHWFPQQDLLGYWYKYDAPDETVRQVRYDVVEMTNRPRHPKIRAFVTHGGLLSLFETVYHGVPVVAMPVFCDHDSNVEKAIQDGYAIRLELQELTATKLLKSITLVISDPKYKKNALVRSHILKDQIESPMERAIFWTEYVIRHKGAQVLQSPAKDLNFVKYYLLDVVLLAAVLIYVFAYLSYVLLKFSGKLFACKYHIKVKVK